MGRQSGVLDRLDSLGRTLGERGHEPTVVAGVIGLECLVFSALYYGFMAFGQLQWTAVGRYDPLLRIVGLFVLTVVNAYATTWIVWRAARPTGTWRYRYGAGLGLAVGLACHVTLAGFYGVLRLAWTGDPGDAFGLGLLALVFGPILTAGIPILLSLGTILLVTHYRQQMTVHGGSGST